MSKLPAPSDDRESSEPSSRLSYLEAAIDAVPSMVCFVDRDRRYRLCNRAYAARQGLKPADLIGRTVSEVLGAEAWQAVQPHLDAALAGETREFETDLVLQGAGLRHLRVNYSPQRDAAGNVTGIVVVIADCAPAGKAEAELRESEARLRNMADHSPMILWVTDTTGAWIQLNQRWQDLTGQTTARGLGFGWLEAIHPDDRNAALQSLRRAMEERRDYRTEYRIRYRDESHRWSLVAASPRLSGRGEFLGYIGSIIDIQDRKDTEAALRKSLDRFDIVKDAAQVGFWFCDLPFDVLFWDERVKEHFWLPPDTKVTLETFYEQLHPDDRERTRDAIAQSIETRRRYDMEYRTVDAATRAEKWIRAIGRTFYDAEGRPIRFDGVTLDITERRNSENALRDAKDQAERASRAKDDFLAQLSHELRTPLTPVLMTATALADDERLPPEAREQLTMMVRNVSLEARLIDDLLDLTRIAHGKLALRTELCDVHSLLALVVDIVSEETREKQIKLTLDLGATRHHLPGDSARLQQVFWNLLRNAAKFTPENGHILIRSRDCASAAGESRDGVRIEVVDDGVGFDPAISARLFEPFERGHAAHDQRFPGLGLGLSIARAIVALHGGNIVASSPGTGRGSTFTVEFPGARLAIGHAPGWAASRSIVPETPGVRSLRLLVVEDHQSTREVLTRLLQRDGHLVIAAGSAGEALAAADKATFDVVLSDLGLPDASGLTLMKQLSARHGLKGVALSGYGMEEDIRRTAEAGFFAHLVKPIVLQDIRGVLLKVSREIK